MRRTPLHRKTPMRRTALVAAPKPKRSHERDPIPLSTRKAVWARSGGLCECGCDQRAAHLHHRKLRSQGGTNDAANLLHLTTECHGWAHAHPTEAVARGLIVPSFADPAATPVIRQEAA